MSNKLRQVLKDVLLVAAVFAAISGAYYGFAVVERYRGLTRAYLKQAEQISQILQRQIPPKDK